MGADPERLSPWSTEARRHGAGSAAPDGTASPTGVEPAAQNAAIWTPGTSRSASMTSAHVGTHPSDPPGSPRTLCRAGAAHHLRRGLRPWQAGPQMPHAHPAVADKPLLFTGKPQNHAVPGFPSWR
jgi:hypothetical protein